MDWIPEHLQEKVKLYQMESDAKRKKDWVMNELLKSTRTLREVFGVPMDWDKLRITCLKSRWGGHAHYDWTVEWKPTFSGFSGD